MVISMIKKNKLVSISLALYLLTFMISKDQFVLAILNTRYYLVEMIFVMPVIFMLTVLIDTWISKESIMKHLGEGSGLRGATFSFILGSLSAGPVYAAFPISKMLLAKGASIVNIVVILSAWAVIKVPMLANEARFLGPKFMMFRWVLTVIAIYIMAVVTGMLVKKEDIPQMEESSSDGLSINEDQCIGCGLCAKMLPSIYEMSGKKAVVKTVDISNPVMNDIIKTIDKCPTKAISIDTGDGQSLGKFQAQSSL